MIILYVDPDSYLEKSQGCYRIRILHPGLYKAIWNAMLRSWVRIAKFCQNIVQYSVQKSIKLQGACACRIDMAPGKEKPGLCLCSLFKKKQLCRLQITPNMHRDNTFTLIPTASFWPNILPQLKIGINHICEPELSHCRQSSPKPQN